MKGNVLVLRLGFGLVETNVSLSLFPVLENVRGQMRPALKIVQVSALLTAYSCCNDPFTI